MSTAGQAADLAGQDAPANPPLPAETANAAADNPQSADDLSSMPYGERHKAGRLEVPAFTGKPDYPSEAFLVKLETSFSTYLILQKDWVRFALSRSEGKATKFQVELTLELAGQEGQLAYEAFKHKLLARFPVRPRNPHSTSCCTSCILGTICPSSYRTSIARSLEQGPAKLRTKRCCRKYS